MPYVKTALQYAADYAFWVFVAAMIVLGSTVSAPFI